MGRPAHAFASQVRAILATDDTLADELCNVDVPTLVIVGNQDILTPRGDSEEIAERIPGAELVVISGAAHGFMVEHASTFNRILLDFLRRATEAPFDAAVGIDVLVRTANCASRCDANLARHQILSIPADERRRAAVAVVVVDSSIEPADSAWIMRRLAST